MSVKVLIHNSIHVLRNRGIKGFIIATKEYFIRKKTNRINLNNIEKNGLNEAWNSRRGFEIDPYAFGVDKESYDLQRKNTFVKKIKFSILVPLYNTPENFLKEMIGSVLFQSYSDWELCLADGSDDKHGYVQTICEEIAQKDSRIKYLKLDKNEGISGNTNACIDMANGDFISLFDHDDLLHPSALYETMRAICDENADFVYTDEATFESPNLHKIITAHYKPDFAQDTLISNNYICHFSSFKRELVNKIGKIRSKYDGAQDQDFILRLTDAAKKIVHVKKILYFWRSHPQSTAMNIGSKTYAIQAGQNASKDFVNSKGWGCDEVISSNVCPTIYRVKYSINSYPLISIIIPSFDHVKILKKCIESITKLTTYKNYEIIIVENNSKESETFDYYEELKKDNRIRILYWKNTFNYSAINNFAVEEAKGEFLMLLNNDIEVITPNWIEEMLMFAQRSDVGAVGAMLYYPNNRIQHAGIILGLGPDRIAGHAFHMVGRDEIGYMGRTGYVQNLSAVTAACLLINKKKYLEVDGFNEKFAVSYNDVDFCLRLRSHNYVNIWTPFAELYHHESISRGLDSDSKNISRATKEKELFVATWKKMLDDGDPYYNPNLSLDNSYFEANMNAVFGSSVGFCEVKSLPQLNVLPIEKNNIFTIDKCNGNLVENNCLTERYVSVKKKSEYVNICGWAVDIADKLEFDSMYITTISKVAKIDFLQNRQDVANVFNIPSITLGFNIAIPRKFIVYNEDYTAEVNFYFVKKNKKIMYGPICLKLNWE